MIHFGKKWCSFCYHNNKNTLGICDADAIHQHYEAYHKSLRNEWPSTDAKKAFPVTFKDSTPYLYDEVPCEPPPQSAFAGARIYLKHTKRQTDIVQRIELRIQYAIAFYKTPLRSAHNNYEWSLHTLWSTEMDGLFVVKISELIPVYPLLKRKLLDEYPEVMDDVLCRRPSNLKQMTFKRKALNIIREIKHCVSWIRFFMKPVDEIKDCATDYYKIISNPMDINTLKTLVENKSIQNPKEFCAKLTSIWRNAQKYNPAPHKVNQYASKCDVESQRLIDKYFPELFRESISSEPCAIVNYDNNVRRSLSCHICKDKLSFLVGFHTDCTMCAFTCNECKCRIKDTSIAYYHCVKGCKSNNHSVYLCETCAADDYDSIQIESLPFNGLWVSLGIDEQNDFFFEAILCRQEANRVFFKLIFHTNADIGDEVEFVETEATVIDSADEIRFEIDQEPHSFNIANTTAKLNSSYSQLQFMNPDDQKDVNAYDKVTLKCGNTGCDSSLLFMQKNTIPTYDDTSLHCDVHKQYYDNKHMKCISRKAYKYDDSSSESIYDVAFYYTCVKCKDFDMCAGCVLIKMEQEWMYKNHQQFESGQSKKRKRSYSFEKEDMQQKRRRIKSKTVMKKQKASRKKSDREHIKNEVDRYSSEELYSLYLKEKEKNQKLSSKNESLVLEVDKWKCKFEKLFSKVKQVFLNDQHETLSCIQIK